VARIVAVNRIGAGETAAPAAETLAMGTEMLVTAAPARFRTSAARLFDEPLPDPRMVRPAPQAIRLAAGS
jgi:hypothetical protein